MTEPRILVITIVHHPLDARIHARQIASLRRAGWQITYAAPWSATKAQVDDHLRVIDLPRASGRRRLSAIRAARGIAREEAAHHDVILVHDPEVLIALAGLRHVPPIVWDVHEDVAASLGDRGWLPRWAVPIMRPAVRVFERWADNQHDLLLAEESYRDRFHRRHEVVRNLPIVPPSVNPPGPGRAVYLGRISLSRGLNTLLALPDRMQGRLSVELIGSADPDVVDTVQAAHDAGHITWHGYVPNRQALEILDGATVGLSLLGSEPNFRGSLPTKVAEYLAHGIPVVTTPLPEAVRLVEASGGGMVVPFDDTAAAAAAAVHYHTSPEARHAASAAGHAWAQQHLDWRDESERFVTALTRIVSRRNARPAL